VRRRGLMLDGQRDVERALRVTPRERVRGAELSGDRRGPRCSTLAAAISCVPVVSVSSTSTSACGPRGQGVCTESDP
jgi:hypothetical protein